MIVHSVKVEKVKTVNINVGITVIFCSTSQKYFQSYSEGPKVNFQELLEMTDQQCKSTVILNVLITNEWNSRQVFQQY